MKILLLMLVLCAALAAQTKSDRRHINLPGKNPNLPFSDAVLVNDTLYIAGRLGLDPKTGQAPSDLDHEARLMMDGVKKVLEQAGMAMDDLVNVTIYCSDVSLFDQFNKVYTSYFTRELPARAFIGSGKLLRGARFEIQAIAVKR